ncbi:endo-1,4-beta-xylanase [Steroidobacter sp. S1-65]|uniref:Endo-1,4-beta-xylanase n=1 Tax=Steroidobacter gossypii TaxID=2805490 RepID=A0ABS1WUP3_9GAMM|nr:endo-1,4-beta-xylanase [Steroidobacter gossypii]MBM0104697.1 endo-1,4-beta-xylanase [Steroidobacter gossypii]
MSMDSRALLSACVFWAAPLAAVAQTEPIIVEAESATVSSGYAVGTADGATYVTIVNDSPGFGPPATADGALTYSVTFPAAGNYDLYARFRVGPGGGSDDSFFIGNGFGDKVGTSEWVLVNQVDGGGFTAPADTVRNGGPATTNVFKWFRLTGFAGPATWTVPEGNLTQVFSAAGRETGNFIDKFAFGHQGSWYTVNDLDTGSAATGTPPPPPPPPYTPPGPPIATGKAKFLGSAHSPAQTANFAAYWNQVTPENGGKWATVESTRDVMNWAQADAAYQMARDNGFIFKWHVLVWGNQQPEWMQNLPPAEQLEELREWFAAIAERYPDLEQIEVVNEPLHDPPLAPANTPAGQSCGGCGNYYEALGGAGATGWDWIINAFALAREYFPDAKLMLNDYSIVNDGNAVRNYVDIVKLLKARGLIDLVGIQGHAFSTTEPAPMPNLRANLDYLASKTALPIYVTELDIDGNDDPVQLAGYQKIFPVFWEHPAVRGITLWGYRPGHWRTAQGAWLVYENGAERPAMQWLQRYVRNDRAEVVHQWLSVAGNAPTGTVVGTANARDADTDTTLSEWQTEYSSGGIFAIDADTGAITVADAAGLSAVPKGTELKLFVSVWDGYQRSEPGSVSIVVR